MTTTLRSALERLDLSIDRLESAATEAMRKRGKGGGVQSGARNRTEVLGKLDAVIEKVETFLTSH